LESTELTARLDEHLSSSSNPLKNPVKLGFLRLKIFFACGALKGGDANAGEIPFVPYPTGCW
jgi:hypothetical protein